MGSCCSINEANRVRKSNISRSRRSQNISDPLNNNTNSIDVSKGGQNDNIIKSSYSIFHRNDKLNTDLNLLIDKYSDKLTIKKLNYIQLYNIFMNYIYDFSNSNFIICDTREESKDRHQIFIKKFNQINYSLRELQIMSRERTHKFCNYLKNKNIIFILKDESSLDIMEKFMIYFISNNSDGRLIIKNIYILSEYIQLFNKNNTSYLDYLYYFIDEDIIYDYSPKILINSNDIKSPYLNNDNLNPNTAYVFINTYPHNSNIFNNKKDEKNRANNKFDINYICHKNTEESDIFLNFFAKFNIYYILNFVLSNDDYTKNNSSKIITHSEAKRNKIENEDKKSIIKQKNIIIPKNITFEDFFVLIKNDFFSIIEEFENEVIDNNCILIEFDNDIDIIFKFKLIYIITSRITELPFDEIYNYLKNNFFDIENESLILSKKDEIIKSISSK